MDQKQTYATIRFDVPDNSVGPEERCLFGPPGAKEVVEERIELHNFRTSTEVVKGPEGLDVQGFTYISHRSALQNADQWLTSNSIVETYIPETEDLICKITGAKKAVANNVFFRRKLVSLQSDPKFCSKKGSEIDQQLNQLPRDVNNVFGIEKEEESLEPARMAHMDYSVVGLRDSARYCRKDIKAAAQEALDAEDANAENVPRYAAYSVWRPIKPVKRDPLSVCDWRTVDKENGLEHMQYRALSDVNESGEFMTDGYLVQPPKKPIQQKWYWMPEQQPDEVLIIKFADTAAEGNPDIAGGSPHVSPQVEGTENEEPRNSIEMRVFAFW